MFGKYCTNRLWRKNFWILGSLMNEPLITVFRVSDPVLYWPDSDPKPLRTNWIRIKIQALRTNRIRIQPLIRTNRIRDPWIFQDRIQAKTPDPKSWLCWHLSVHSYRVSRFYFISLRGAGSCIHREKTIKTCASENIGQYFPSNL